MEGAHKGAQVSGCGGGNGGFAQVELADHRRQLARLQRRREQRQRLTGGGGGVSRGVSGTGAICSAEWEGDCTLLQKVDRAERVASLGRAPER